MKTFVIESGTKLISLFSQNTNQSSFYNHARHAPSFRTLRALISTAQPLPLGVLARGTGILFRVGSTERAPMSGSTFLRTDSSTQTVLSGRAIGAFLVRFETRSRRRVVTYYNV